MAGALLRRDRLANRRQTLTDAFQREARPMLADPFLFLQRSMTNAHHAILDFAADHSLRDSPRTTCVACVIQDSIAYWAHAGDFAALPDARRPRDRPDPRPLARSPAG